VLRGGVGAPAEAEEVELVARLVGVDEEAVALLDVSGEVDAERATDEPLAAACTDAGLVVQQLRVTSLVFVRERQRELGHVRRRRDAPAHFIGAVPGPVAADDQTRIFPVAGRSKRSAQRGVPGSAVKWMFAVRRGRFSSVGMVRVGDRGSAGVSEPARETLLLAGLAVAGAGLVAVVLRIEGWVDYTPSAPAKSFDNEAGWSLWLVLLAAQGALWGILLPSLLRSHAALGARPSRRDLVVALAPLVALSVAVDVARSRNTIDSPLPHHFAKVTVLTWLGTAVALVAVAGIVRVGRAAWAFELGSGGAAALERYVQLRASLRQFLVSAGAVVAGAVLAAGALQQALGKQGHPEVAFAYGIFLSALLAAAYAPAFAQLQRAGERVLDAIEPPPAAGEPDWPLGSERRRQLRSFLDLDIDFLQSLRVGVALLAPLASGLVGLLLPS
jgi:hypothetical protein